MSKSTKSFIKGIGQSIDIGGALTPRNAKTGDKALAADWKAVGRDIQKAIDKAPSSNAPKKSGR